MSCLHPFAHVRNFVVVTILTINAVAVTPAFAQSGTGDVAIPVGRIEFDFPSAPAATVEVDLSQGMMSALSGIGQGAITGVAQALIESSNAGAAPPIQQSAEHLEAVNQILATLSGVVHEVHVRVYENLETLTPNTRSAMLSHYQERLQKSDWDSVVRVREDTEGVTLNILRENEAIRGFFILVSERDELVMVNVVCNLTPDQVQDVTREGTKIGMKFGLEKAIQQAMVEIERELN